MTTDYRPRDRLGRRQPRQIFRDALFLLRTFPALAQAFETRVPAEYVEPGEVRCTCGQTTPILVNSIKPCIGDCGRNFLRVSADEVRVAREPAS
jgi:hypothetical protein